MLSKLDNELMRKIVHVDLDAFYSAVEQRDNPSLRGQPIAVGFDGERGVVMTASYEARAYGVRSAMSSAMAKQKCPGLVFVKPRLDVYRSASREIREVFMAFTDLVEPLSLDEAYLDVTAPKRGPSSGTLIARMIKTDIKAKTDLTASAGVSYNKFLAKIASGLNKPDGLTVITPEEAEAFVERLPVEAFFGVGPVTARRMHEEGIFTGLDLKGKSLRDLRARFGKAGEHYFTIARGVDERPVDPNRERKSLGAETTFSRDTRDPKELMAALLPLCETVASRLERAGLGGCVVVLKVKFRDFRIITRRMTLPHPIHEAQAIHKRAVQLLLGHVELVSEVRLIGVSLQEFSRVGERHWYQPPLPFEDFVEEA
jgi:DNA polymerase-4